ncbi:ABC transporter permease [Luteimonas fraxinea]|uniref:Transport permease protein n=1 Tax=Luteimonas fraxinea TaxID=2901869 RepID=A0ABS8U975_9GAMM|nr:ABC transporter permease [Luteimonas fraxinea]MCD9095624.1 ABC transporter permease [Luteimonas fraxinea]MCD9124206.1 ABC transporter permease [Luteimonas fraxinea]UHH11182.1 ABC transporter permease [Luteimonas fraxinea]
MDTTLDTGTRVNLWRCYLLDTRCELLRLLREPMYIIPTLLFPALFYVMFGLLLGGRGSGEAARYLLATYGVFGAMGAGLFGFAVTLAIDRERGFFALRRALPAPPSAWLVSRLLIAMLFALVIVLELAALAVVFGGVSMTAGQWALLWTVTVLGALPFCAIGLLLGSIASANAAPAWVNLLFLPMAFLSGLWLPLSMLPGVFATLAPLWPAWHLAQVALGVTGQAGTAPLWLHLLVLTVVTVACCVLALRRLARAV